jgi:hypothetical protein
VSISSKNDLAIADRLCVAGIERKAFWQSRVSTAAMSCSTTFLYSVYNQNSASNQINDWLSPIIETSGFRH